MKLEQRESLLAKLRHPGPAADMLIEHYLGHPNGTEGCRPYTQQVEAAMSLLPEGLHFLCGRSGESELFWCDIGYRPQVQAWGETMAAAIASAVFAYHTHPDVMNVGDSRSHPYMQGGSQH
jgi:hypothetical protein